MQVAKWGVNRMPLIGKAWKANVNVWKRHLTLQSVFNRGECMMHVDKNTDDHVMDQNVDRISREIAYVPLGRGIRSKCSSCMQLFFFFFFEWVQDMLTWRTTDPGSYFQKTKDFWALAHVFRGPKILDPSSCFHRPRILGLGTCFQRTKGFLGFGSCFQRTKGSGSWLMMTFGIKLIKLTHAPQFLVMVLVLFSQPLRKVGWNKSSLL